ncbi:hypothetical protein DBV05_g2684 [Lasiodiplodia theobromae]|uniref:Uncharacterized protein n=1 Tax=Lasiodiplodia theobromae TaxID=45133 RepID=A0A5N5DLP9_9PEZI|nr:hypothetical protein DBV05_g2684 [Lasiodiplodia theobromae]
MVATSFIPLLLATCAHANVIPRTISSTYKNATHSSAASSQSSEGLSFVFAGENPTSSAASSQSSEGLSFVFAGEDPTSSAAPSKTSAALSFAFPSKDSASSGAASPETSVGISFAFPSSSSSSSSSSSKDVLVGIDMGFTRSTRSAPLTIGIDLGPPTATSSRIGTPVGTPVGTPAAGNVSVSEQGFDFGFGGPTGAPSLVLTMIDGSFVLATVGASSTKPATTVPAGATTSSKISLPVVTTAAPQEPTSRTPFEVGGITVSQNSDTQLVVGSQTLAVGSSVIVGSGSSTTAIVLQTDGSSTRIVVGTATAAVPAAEPTSGGSGEAAAPFEVGGITVSRNSASQIVIGTQTLGGAAGSSIVVGSGSFTTAVVLQTDASGATQVVVGGTTTAAIPTAAPISGVEGDPDAIVFGSQTLHPGSTLTLGSGSSTTKLVLQTYSAGGSAIVVADASTTYTVAAPTRASALPTLAGGGVQLITTGLTTELVVGGTQTYTFKTGGPSIGLVTEGGTTIVVAGGTGSGGTRIPIPTGLGKETSGASASASGSSGRSSRSTLGSATGSSRTTTAAAESSAAASGLSSGLGGDVDWATASASASASASGSVGAAARMVDGAVVGTGLVSAVCAVLALIL